MPQESISILVTVRTGRDGAPELFFVNENERGYWLKGYAHVGQHFEPSRSYMQSRPLMSPDALTPEAAALVREWSCQPPDNLRAVVVRRLKYPKGKPYIGKL